MNNPIDYKRLSYLGDKVKTGQASKNEKDEFMLMLHKNGSINSKQYDDYTSNQNTDEIVNAALGIGVVILIGYLLNELFKGK